MSSTRSSRLFFALWPPVVLGSVLSDLARDIALRGNGRCVPQHNIHLTLAFLGALDESRQQCAEQAASVIQSVSFSVLLDQLGFWSGPGIVWVGPTEIPAPLHNLAKALHAGLTDCGITLEKRPFKPHLTLVRKMRPGQYPLSIKTQKWDIDQIHLVRSETRSEGAHYQILRSWPLQPS